MGEGGGGRRSVVRGGAAVPQLAAVEGAAAGGAPGEAEAVRRGGVADAVSRRHRVPLATGRHCNTGGGGEVTTRRFTEEQAGAINVSVLEVRQSLRCSRVLIRHGISSMPF